MIIKSAQKRNGEVKTQLSIDNDGSYYALERKDHIKYLGVIIDDNLNLKYKFLNIKPKIARHEEIILFLLRYLSLQYLQKKIN